MTNQQYAPRRARPWRGQLLVILALFGPILATFFPEGAGGPAIDTARGAPLGTPAFERTWARTDRPVAEGRLSRTWMWGPAANTGVLTEPYAEAPGGQRSVQYFDKTRMEDNAYRAGPPWDVTNGLLARELITGQMQLGDNQFEQREPARVYIAGDPDPAAPTYATFSGLMTHQPLPQGSVITQTVDASGAVGADESLAGYGVTAAYHVPETNHTVASVFWAFMNSVGPVYENGQHVEARLFENPFYATGFPLTEAYWTTVKVGGVPKRVLVQVFERRVLTYTPDNPDGWKVEAGNVGQHYYRWRYGGAGLAAELAQRIVEAPSLWEAVRATEEALAQTGIATAREGTTYQDAVAPIAATRATPAETLAMAMEARDKETTSHLTLAEFAQILADLGWPFRADASPGAQLVEFLGAWHAEALKSPNDPYNFPPLFLAAMGTYQSPPVDLASGAARAEDVRLTMLEARILAASLERYDPGSVPFDWSGGLAVPLDETAAPCSEMRREWGVGGGDAAHVVANQARRKAVSEALRRAGVEADDRRTFGQALGVLRILDRLYRLVVLYGHATIWIAVLSDNPVHKPQPDEADKLAAFKAYVGIDDAEWQEYLQKRGEDAVQAERMVRDCLDFLGLPWPETVGSLARSIGGWRVEWSAVKGMPEHAVIMPWESGFDMPGQYQHNVALVPGKVHQAETTGSYVIKLQQEPDHPAEGWVERTAEVVVEAELETSSRPSVQTFVSAGQGPLGLASSLAELLSGWYQEIDQPEARARLLVTYHEPAGYRVRVTMTWDLCFTCDIVGPVGSGQVTWVIDLPSDFLTNPAAVGRYEATGAASGRYQIVRPEGIEVVCTTSWSGSWAGEVPASASSVDAEARRIQPDHVLTHWGNAEESYVNVSGDDMCRGVDLFEHALGTWLPIVLVEQSSQTVTVPGAAIPAPAPGFTGSVTWMIEVESSGQP